MLKTMKGKLMAVMSLAIVAMMSMSASAFAAIPELDSVSTEVGTMATEAKSYGVPIVLGAIAVGIIFVLALWIWMLAKGWIKKAKG